MKFFIPLIIIFVSFAFDPSIYLSYHTPKNLLLIVLIPFCLLIFCFAVCKAKGFLTRRLVRNDNCEVPQSESLFRKNSKEFYLSFSIIEILLLIRLIWLIITNPKLLTHPSDLEFWILVSLFLLTFLARQILSSSKERNRIFKHFFRSLLIIGLVQTLIGFYQFYLFNDLSGQFIKTPIIGLIGSANGFGIFASISIIAALVDFFSQDKLYKKIIILISTSLILISLLLNGSRGALFALVCTIFIVSLVFISKYSAASGFHLSNSIKQSFWNKVKTFKIIILIFLGPILIAFGILLSKLNMESTKGRLMIWEISAPMFFGNPIFGVGQNRYGVEYLNYQAEYFQDKENIQYSYKAANLKQAHNEFIQAFCESGIIGGIIFLAICLYPLWLLLRKIINDNSDHNIFYLGLVGILLAILIHSLIDCPLHVLPVSVIFYSALGLAPAKAFRIQFNRHVQFLLIVVIFLYTIFIGNKAIRQYSSYKLWQNGVESTRKYTWDNAIQNYKSALTGLPKKGELQFHLGSAMVMNENYLEGIGFLKSCLNNFNDRNIYLSLSYAYFRLNKYSLAEKYSKTALAMFPDHLAPHLLLGEIYYKLGEIEKSKTSLIKCINQETHFHSFDTYRISWDAKKLWNRFYKNFKINSPIK